MTRAGPGSVTAVVSLGCGIATVVCLVLAGQLADSSAGGAFAASVVALVLGLIAFVCGAVAHRRILRAGRGRLLEAVAGWSCGLAGILIGPYLSYAIVLGVAWKSFRKP